MQTKRVRNVFWLAVLLLAAGLPAHAANSSVPERILGNPKAPVTIDEYASLTCPHCAEFTIQTLPKLEKLYIDTGKVKFILHDFPLDGVALKAAALARCMPADEFYPFIEVLYKNQTTWALASDPDAIISEYARLGGLSGERTKECLNDKSMQDAVAAERAAAEKTYNINSTPTFIIDGGAEKVLGAQPVEAFAAAIDKALAKRKAEGRKQMSDVKNQKSNK
ncbi:MAG TPA: DsbA family protein [Alphaproteobacteria bacterium]|nr:DsbA family protein [Alphaproteobacteria bacterium]